MMMDEDTIVASGTEETKQDEYSLGSSEEVSLTPSVTEISTLSQEPAPQTAQRHSVLVDIPKLELHATTVESRVANGEKKGDGMGAYQTYIIKSKTTLPDFKNKEPSVERRFSDFIWLHDTLQQHHRGVIVPPSPDKETLIIQDRFGSDFIETRRKELERFLKRITSHPILCVSKHLQTFLESNEADFQAAKTQKEGGGGVWESFFGASKKIASNITTSISGVTEVDPWFEEKTKYFNLLETHLSQLYNTFVNVVRKYFELSFNHAEFGVFSVVVASEEKADKDLSFAFEKVGSVSDQIGELQKELAQSQKDFFEDEVKEYFKLIAAVKVALNFRTEKLAEFQAATRDHTGRKDKIQQLKDASKPVTAAMETDLEKAHANMEEKKAAFEATSRNVRAEIERFLALKSQALQSAIASLIQTNLSYELRVVDHWKKLLDALPAPTLENH